jgi:hypothetical protein
MEEGGGLERKNNGFVTVSGSRNGSRKWIDEKKLYGKSSDK